MVGEDVTTGVAVADGLGVAAGDDNCVYATTLPMMMTRTTIAATITYVVFIFYSPLLFKTSTSRIIGMTNIKFIDYIDAIFL